MESRITSIVNPQSEKEIMSFIQVQPVVVEDLKTRCSWCTQKYPGHPKGCPNFGKKAGCPPIESLFEVIAYDRPIFAIYNAFDFGSYCRKMRLKHPDWSEPQIRCCLYWQRTVRNNQLRPKIKEFCKHHRKLKIIGTPEAMGVEVTQTMGMVGIHLEWPPENVAYQIVVAGTSIKSHVDEHEFYHQYMLDFDDPSREAESESKGGPS